MRLYSRKYRIENTLLYTHTPGDSEYHAYQVRTRIRTEGEKGRRLLSYHVLYRRQRDPPKEGEPGLHREDQRRGRRPTGALAGMHIGPRTKRPARKIVRNGFKIAKQNRKLRSRESGRIKMGSCTRHYYEYNLPDRGPSQHWGIWEHNPG